MPERPESRFDAQTFGRLATVHKGRRFEMELCDAGGKNILVTLPWPVAVELGCMICDIAEQAPYLIGGVRSRRKKPSDR